jgi:hypothetical protein
MLYGVAAPEGCERRHLSDCGFGNAPLARNAYRIGRGTVLEGKIPGVLLPPVPSVRLGTPDRKPEAALDVRTLKLLGFAHRHV